MAPGADQVFNNTQTPLRDKDFTLLSQNGYQLQGDGTIRPPGSTQPLRVSDVPLVLDELTSRQRLQAMMELNVIFNKYGTKNLPDDALEDVRRIGRQNWPVLPEQVRSDLKSYFSVKEVEEMNAGVGPMRVPQTWLPLEAPGPYEVADSTSSDVNPYLGAAQAVPAAAGSAPAPSAAAQVQPAAAPAPQAAPVAAQAAPIPAAATVAAQIEPAVAATQVAPVPTAPPAPAPSAPVAQISGAATAAVSAVAAAVAPTVTPAAQPAPAVKAAAAAQAAVPAQAPSGYTFKTSAAEPARLQAVGAVGTQPAAAPAAPTAPAAPQPVEYPETPPETFKQFLAQAPYGRQAQDLLAMISDHAAPEARKTALGEIARYTPLVFVDSRRAGRGTRAAIVKLREEGGPTGQYLVALSPGPLMVARKSLFSRNKQFLLPDDPEYYKSLGVPAPALQAAGASPDANREEEVTERGPARVFEDGSARLEYGLEQMAGDLLREITFLDPVLRGLPADAYGNALLARTRQFLFYRRLQKDTGKSPALSADALASYREWQDRPQDDLDFVVQALAAPVSAAVLPDLSGGKESRAAWRKLHDRSLLDEAGLTPAGEADSQQPADAAVTASPEAEAALLPQAKSLGELSAAGKQWLEEETRFRAEAQADEKK